MNEFPDFLVAIHCSTYNHAPYIEDAMNGFCMQQTTFPFVAIIVDDASTDGEPAVIENYLNSNFDFSTNSENKRWETDEARFIFVRHKENKNCYFAVVLLRTNFYSQHKSKDPFFYIWDESAKYIALCEGDDYWIDPNKLQIQVDFMESHHDYSMCWHDAAILNAIKGEIIGNHRRYKKDSTCRVEDLIEGGGDFCPTASLMYRNGLREKAPKELFHQNVGDYPLQLYLTLIGKVYYFDRCMSVYRTNVSNSWTDRMLTEYSSVMKTLWFYEKKICDDFNRFSYYKYNRAFKQHEYTYLFKSLWKIKDYTMAGHYWHKIDWRKRPWNLRWILYMHGYGKLRSFFVSKIEH